MPSEIRSVFIDPLTQSVEQQICVLPDKQISNHSAAQGEYFRADIRPSAAPIERQPLSCDGFAQGKPVLPIEEKSGQSSNWDFPLPNPDLNEWPGQAS